MLVRKRYVLPVREAVKAIKQASNALPREAAGLLLCHESHSSTLLTLLATSSDDNTASSFRIRDEAIDGAAESLRGSGTPIVGCFHSHVVGPARPSRIDRLEPKSQGELWLIYSVRLRELALFEWEGTSFRRRPYHLSA